MRKSTPRQLAGSTKIPNRVATPDDQPELLTTRPWKFPRGGGQLIFRPPRRVHSDSALVVRVPRRTRIRPSRRTLESTTPRDHQPVENHRHSPSRPRPHPLRAGADQLIPAEISSPAPCVHDALEFYDAEYQVPRLADLGSRPCRKSASRRFPYHPPILRRSPM